VSRYITSAPSAQKTHVFVAISINLRRDVFTSTLRSNVRDTDLIENIFSVEICYGAGAKQRSA
jgi:hypothetical protein